MTLQENDLIDEHIEESFDFNSGLIRDEWSHTPSTVEIGETPDGDICVEVLFYDNSHFHIKYAEIPFQDEDEDDSVLQYVSAHTVRNRLFEICPELNNQEGWHLSVDNAYLTQGWVIFSIEKTFPRNTVTVKQLSEEIDVFDSALLNSLDPGTFGHEYLYQGILTA